MTPPKLLTLGIATMFLSACATTGSPIVGGKVEYGDAKAVETVTTDFGSTDLQLMAETMTRSMLQAPVITRASDRPLVTIADIKNKTSEYIDTRAITNTIRTQLLKSGSVRFATDIADMKAQTDELVRQNQSGLYKKTTQAKIGKMEGAQYRMEGEITSIVKRGADVKDVYYKLSLILTNTEAGTVEWADEKDIRKTAKR